MSVAAIIPAYNEEKTIGDVLDIVCDVPIIDEVIVISDGSSDGTVNLAKSYGVKVIELKDNIGKGGAIKAGLKECKSENVLLLDADLIGLKREHLHDLIYPVILNKADMTVGIFKHGRAVTDIAQKIAPNLSGQRVIKKYIIDEIEDLDFVRYGIEVALTIHTNKNSYRVEEIDLEDITHLTKEEKLGFIPGFTSRLKMYKDILKVLGKSVKH
ncbi:glycosyltransferase family 2 protein [Lutispora saccharofermentans]|uniref:Glucosyl-3-phosphoglycerate synthase n=1 Tax=Lutispora saccharofermentans TaxID=3024236 RepID=A0ABT1NBF5_9FIRM|nr:glycosyltransferase family 2 protein [Lutispora saccharofermentans]MCQ1527959.1 glycosyltransferase family 2 protein [Lutispora saccharofermentans]